MTSFYLLRPILLALVILGCSQSANAQPQRPVVFIPGILGSRLVDESGNTVWGDRGSLSNFDQLEIIETGSAKKLRPDGLVERINMLGPFWTIHQYDAIVDQLRAAGFERGKDFFVFAYDWRRSNFDTAKEFAEFVNNTPALNAQQFDVVVHSMGGIVAKIWLHNHAGSSRVGKVIYLGTPFRGSMNVFGTLSEGWGKFANLIAGGLPTIRRVALSFPSLYELLPTYDGCCRLGTSASHTLLDVLSPTTWQSRDWLPDEYRPGASRADAFSQGLASARKVAELMKQPKGSHEEVMFAGDILDTRLYLYVPIENQSWRGWQFRTSRGDGTVPVWSAVNNFTSLAGSNPSFVEHATIFADDWVTSKLKRELVPSLPPPVKGEMIGAVVTTSGATKVVDNVIVELDPPLAEPDANVILSVALDFANAVGPGEIGLSAVLLGAMESKIVVTEVTTPAEASSRRLTFRGKFKAPSAEDNYRIDVILPSLGVRSVYLGVALTERMKP